MIPSHTNLTFGSGGITDPNNPECLQVTRMAMEAGVWFHVANYGGGVYRVLKQAFAEAPTLVPRCIVKIDGQGPDLLRNSVMEALRETGLARLDIGQVCGNPVDDSFEPTLEVIAELQEKGLIGPIIMDVIKSYSEKVEQAIDRNLFEGYIFYYNVTERQLSQPVQDRITAQRIPVYAMRTFGGRCPQNLLNGDPDHPRRRALDALFEASGCLTLLDFCVRFPLSHPHVVTTVGSTGKVEHLKALLDAIDRFEPLPPSVVEEIDALHAEWE